jgi:type III pantothenate kinase
MFLCIDFGNTNVKTAVFNNDNELYYYKNRDLSIQKIQWIIQKFEVKKTIVSSTRSLGKDYLQQLSELTHLIILNEHTLLPIINGYRTPATLGKDRIATVVAANNLFPDKTVVVLDVGTCITLDVIDNKGYYHGGNISPGLYMKRQAMYDFTDKLPLVDFKYPNEFIGKSTEEALQNGILRGTLYEIQTFINLVIEKFGETQVVITGGDTKFFEEHLKFTIFASSNLVLKGLNEILKIND